MVEYRKCACGEKAVWVYVPVTDKKDIDRHFCDGCVPRRGCECHYRYVEMDGLPCYKDSGWMWIHEPFVWTHIDTKGREYPCVEFDHVEDGFEIK